MKKEKKELTTFSIALSTKEKIQILKENIGITKSNIVDLGVKELYKKYKNAGLL